MNPIRVERTRSLVLCALFAALISVGAFIRIPVPMMDYFTLQFLFVILAGLLLGPRLGATSAAVYVAMGLAGFPIFAAGGGIQYIFRPSFGYLIGFIVAAYLAGSICQRGMGRLKWNLAAAFAGMAVTYGIGFAYKYLILNSYLNEPAPLGVIVLSAFPLDIPGDAVLCIAGAGLASRLQRVLGRRLAV